MRRILFFNFNPKSVNGLHVGFQELGHTVMNYELSAPLNDQTLTVTLNRLIDTFKPDIIISYGWWIGTNVNLFCSIIKAKGIFHVYWAYDDPEYFELVSVPIGKNCNFVFTTVLEALPLYRSRGIPAQFLFHACNPRKHRKENPCAKFKNDIVLMGNNYNVRHNINLFKYRLLGIQNVLRPLVSANYDVAVYGLWWNNPDRVYTLPLKNIRPFSFGQESKIYSSCKIALGLQSVGTSLTHMSVRTIEVLGCGAFHLTQFSPGVEHYFKKGIHLEWSKSPQETLEIAKFYLANDFARERIAKFGQEEVYKKHTYKHRAESALNIITHVMR